MGHVRSDLFPRRLRRLRHRVPVHRRLRQDPAAVRYWLLVLAVALVLASVVGRAIDRASQAERAWGRATTVYVADGPIRSGSPLAGSVRAERWPAGLVPARAIMRAPTTGRAAFALDSGSVLTASAIERADPAGSRRTLAVALPGGHLPVRAGDRVDLWATRDPAVVPDGEAGTRKVAAEARVVEAGDRSVVVSVEPGQVAQVAEAAATATISLVGSS